MKVISTSPTECNNVVKKYSTQDEKKKNDADVISNPTSDSDDEDDENVSDVENAVNEAVTSTSGEDVDSVSDTVATDGVVSEGNNVDSEADIVEGNNVDSVVTDERIENVFDDDVADNAEKLSANIKDIRKKHGRMSKRKFTKYSKPRPATNIRYMLKDGRSGQAEVLSRQPKRTGSSKDWVNVLLAGKDEPSSINWNEVSWWKLIPTFTNSCFYHHLMNSNKR